MKNSNIADSKKHLEAHKTKQIICWIIWQETARKLIDGLERLDYCQIFSHKEEMFEDPLTLHAIKGYHDLTFETVLHSQKNVDCCQNNLLLTWVSHQNFILKNNLK